MEDKKYTGSFPEFSPEWYQQHTYYEVKAIRQYMTFFFFLTIVGIIGAIYLMMQ